MHKLFSTHFWQLKRSKAAGSLTGSQFQRIYRGHLMGDAKRHQLPVQTQALEAMVVDTPGGRIHVQ